MAVLDLKNIQLRDDGYMIWGLKDYDSYMKHDMKRKCLIIFIVVWWCDVFVKIINLS